MRPAWRLALAGCLVAGCPGTVGGSGDGKVSAPSGGPTTGPPGAGDTAAISGQVFAVATASPYAEAPAAGVPVFLDTLSGEALGDTLGDLRTTTDSGGRFAFRPVAATSTVVVGALLPGNRHVEALASAEAGSRSVTLGPASTLALGFWRERDGTNSVSGEMVGALGRIVSRTRDGLAAGSLRAPTLVSGAAAADHDRYLVDLAAADRQLAGLWSALLGRAPLALGTFAGSWRQGNDGDGGPAIRARLNRPAGIAFGPDGSAYLAEEGHHRIRRVGPDGIIGPFAGAFEGDASVEPFPQLSPDGTDRRVAALPYPRSLVVDGSGNLVAALASHQIVLVAVASESAYGVQIAPGKIYRIAGTATSHPPARSPDAADATGNVPAAQTTLKAPGGMALDGRGNLFVAERLANRVLRIDRSSGVVTALPVSVSGPVDLAWAGSPGATAGELFVYAANQNAIVRIRLGEASAPQAEAFVGSGPGRNGWNGDGPGALTDLADPARFQVAPGGLAVDARGGRLFFADTNNFRIRQVALADPSRAVRTVAGGDGVARGTNFRDGEATRCGIIEPTRLALDPAGNLVFSDRYQYVYRILYLAAEPL